VLASDSPVDLQAIQLASEPAVEYLSVATDSGAPSTLFDENGESSFRAPIALDALSFVQAGLSPVPPPSFIPMATETIQVQVSVTERVTRDPDLPPATVVFTAKAQGRLIAKHVIDVVSGTVAPIVSAARAPSSAVTPTRSRSVDGSRPRAMDGAGRGVAVERA
jgi:hypothetical protein